MLTYQIRTNCRSFRLVFEKLRFFLALLNWKRTEAILIVIQSFIVIVQKLKVHIIQYMKKIAAVKYKARILKSSPVTGIIALSLTLVSVFGTYVVLNKTNLMIRSNKCLMTNYSRIEVNFITSEQHFNESQDLYR